MPKHTLLLALLFALAACSAKPEASNTPQSMQEARKDSRGKLTGEDGLIVSGRTSEDASSASPLGVNSYLWRATLDTLSFMPLASADPFGGVIITDWYEDPKTPGERFKVNALILDKTLRADGVKVTLFKQTKDAKGNWHDDTVDDKRARAVEDTILTRARQLKVGQRK